VEILHPPTREMLFWNRALGRWISPRPDQENFFTRMLGVILVTPSALFANLSVSYQAYLFLLFHRSRLVRAAHALLMPLIMSAVFAGLCTIDVAGVNAGLIALGLLLAWYVVQALANRIFLVALCMVPITCGEYFLGRLWQTQAYTRPEALSPLLWALVLSGIATLTHIAEPDLPPRVTRTAQWVPFWQFLLGTRQQRLAFPVAAFRFVLIGLQIVWGTLDELLAAPRLLPIIILMYLWKLGFYREQCAKLTGLVQTATKRGNPALDYIGTGGGAFLWQALEAGPPILQGESAFPGEA
jgi:hypothetical protein